MIIATQHIQKSSMSLRCYSKCIRMHLRPNFPLFISKLQTFNLTSSFVSINSFVKNTIKLVLVKYIYVYIKTYKKYKINHIKKLLQCNCPDYFILKGQFFLCTESQCDCCSRIQHSATAQNLPFCAVHLKKNPKNNTHHRTKQSS